MHEQTDSWIDLWQTHGDLIERGTTVIEKEATTVSVATQTS
jgi:hypothetical protein